jgi:hypothetical protein
VAEALLTPASVLKAVAHAMPKACLDKVIVVGSLAAAHHYFGDDDKRSIRTKDVDALFGPSGLAYEAASQACEVFLREGWTQSHAVPNHDVAGTPATPLDDLSVLRLQPPFTAYWFIEFFGTPEAHHAGTNERRFQRVSTSQGDFALFSFGYMGLCEWQPSTTPGGLRVAQPRMMALANMLHHPSIGDQLMSRSIIDGRSSKRANKDLGRVLAMVHLTSAIDLDAWAPTWWDALQAQFPSKAKRLALQAGSGIRALVASDEDMRDALQIAQLGILSSVDVTMQDFQIAAERLLLDAIEPMEAMAQQPSAA